MTTLQLRFVEEYVKDRNAKEAVRRAGYSPKRLSETAYDLMRHPDITAAIDKHFADEFARNKMSVDEAISILTDIARTEPADLYNEDGTLKKIHDIPKFARHAIDSVKYKTKFVYDELLEKNVPYVYPTEIKMTSKQTAIEKILRHFGGFEKDNAQKKPDPIVLNINPLGASEVTVDIGHSEVPNQAIGPIPEPLQLPDNEEDEMF